MRVFVLMLLLIAITIVTLGEDVKAPQQAVLISLERQDIEGQTIDVVMVPKGVTVLMGLLPLDRQAPLPPQSTMLCYVSAARVGVRRLDGTDAGLLDDILFTCGGKRYLFTNLQLGDTK